MAPPPRAARWIVLFAQGDPPHPTDSTNTKDPADQAPFRQLGRQPSFQVKPDLGKLTVTSTNNQQVDVPQLYLHPPCRLGVRS
jgi:hypothetical protein